MSSVKCEHPSFSFVIPENVASRPVQNRKLVIAHRGASFHVPEHTLASYRLGLEMGADLISTDIVATQDGQLVALHSLDLNTTTNVATEFPPDRQWFSPYANRTGYWVFNFTLQEVQQLRVRQRYSRTRSAAYDYLWPVPTLADIQQLLNTWNTRTSPEIQKDNDDTTNNTQHEHKYPQTAGLSLELRDLNWYQEETTLRPIDLLLQEVAQNTDDLFHRSLRPFEEATI